MNFRLLCFLFASAAVAAAQSICEVKGPGAGPATAAIQTAIDQCAARGGGVVAVAPGNYTIATLWMKDNVELRLDAGATLLLSQREEDWPRISGPKGLIRAKGAKNFAITGRGTIDGQAQYSWGPAEDVDGEIVEEIEIARKAGVEMNRYRREGIQAYLVLFEDSERIMVEGIRLVNSPIWTVRMQDCRQVWAHGIYLYSSLEKAVNGDGVDLVSTSDVLISDSIIITGDDAICLKTTSLDHNPKGPVRPTENIVVNNCILSSSSTPMMIGTETYGDIRHVLFSNIVVRDSNKAFGINVQDGGTVSDVRFANVTFELNRRHWNWWGNAEVFKFVLKKRTPSSRLGRIENIVIDEVQGTARGTSLAAGHAERPLENITLSNLRVRMLNEEKPDKRATHAMKFEGVRGLTLRNIDVEWDVSNREPRWGSALYARDVDGLQMEGVRGSAGYEKVKALDLDRVKYVGDALKPEGGSPEKPRSP